MTCDPIRDRFDRYLAGTLDSAEQEQVDRHLRTCPACQADLESSRFLVGRTADLPREITPATDLWSGIAPRLKSTARQLSIPVWRLAAAAVTLMIASSALTVVLTRRQQAPVAAAGFALTEARYSQAALELGDLYRQARDSLAPETRAVLERNLAVIDRALVESREALRTDPANRMIEAMVVAAYQRKIAFLERATALDRES